MTMFHFWIESNSSIHMNAILYTHIQIWYIYIYFKSEHTHIQIHTTFHPNVGKKHAIITVNIHVILQHSSEPYEIYLGAIYSSLEHANFLTYLLIEWHINVLNSTESTSCEIGHEGAQNANFLRDYTSWKQRLFEPLCQPIYALSYVDCHKTIGERAEIYTKLLQKILHPLWLRVVRFGIQWGPFRC